MIIFSWEQFILRLNGGEYIENQNTKTRICVIVNAGTLSLCGNRPNHFIKLLPGIVALKATNTTIVFPRTQEMERTKLIPNAVW